MIITIDGPAGSGKSSISALIAYRYKFFYLTSGFIYRAFAHHLLRHNIPYTADNNDMLAALDSYNVSFFKNQQGKCSVIYNDTDISCAIQTEECGMYAANISHMQGIRDKALYIQRNIARQYNHIIVEGRDCGTEIFPQAHLKIYLTASFDARIQRIYDRGGKVKLPFQDLHTIISNRDMHDFTRLSGTLRPAYDAYIIETSHMSLSAVVDYIAKLINKYLALSH